MKEPACLPLVSVVIVSWNACDFLMECLASLTSSASRYPMEIIVVDNDSKDGSPECVEERFPGVRLIRNHANLGFAAGNNIGIKQSQGDYICLVNSDVKVLDNCITRLVEHLEAHPDVGIAGPTMLGGNGKMVRSCRGFPTLWNMWCHALFLDRLFPFCRVFSGYTLRHWSQNTVRSVDILPGWFWIVRKRALDEIGLLDEAFFFYGEDMDWCKRFSLKGWEVVFLATAASIHYGAGSSRAAPLKYYIQEQRADLQYWRKHHSSLEQRLYVGICILYQWNRLVAHAIFLAFKPGDRLYKAKFSRSWNCLLWYCGVTRRSEKLLS